MFFDYYGLEKTEQAHLFLAIFYINFCMEILKNSQEIHDKNVIANLNKRNREEL